MIWTGPPSSVLVRWSLVSMPRPAWCGRSCRPASRMPGSAPARCSAYGVQPAAARRRCSAVAVRIAGAQDLETVARLALVEIQHRSAAPMFAPPHARPLADLAAEHRALREGGAVHLLATYDGR